MADHPPGLLPGMRPELRTAILRATGLPPNVGLMHVLMQATSAEEAEDALGRAIQEARERRDTTFGARLAAALDLLRANPQAFGVVRATLDGLDHQRGSDTPEADQLRYWAEAFNAAARGHPEGSIALYTLGSPELLGAATGEICDRLDRWGALMPTTECLDVGCGIGRMETALAGRLRRIVGIDISAEMVAEARRRTAALPNVEIRQTSGRDLAQFGKASFDLVLWIDSFPYLVGGGGELAATMIRETARVLSQGGRLVILNYSYRGDVAQDRADIEALAARNRLDVLRVGTGDFTLWDAATFDLRKL